MYSFISRKFRTIFIVPRKILRVIFQICIVLTLSYTMFSAIMLVYPQHMMNNYSENQYEEIIWTKELNLTLSSIFNSEQQFRSLTRGTTQKAIANISRGKQVIYNGTIFSAHPSRNSEFNYRRKITNEVPFPIPLPNDTLLLGKENYVKEKRFMTIGISSVWRKENYLDVTIQSILNQTSPDEKLDIYIFILLSDADPIKRIERANEIEQNYKKEIRKGLISILQPPSKLYYPSINYKKIRRTYNDNVSRFKWRIKQVLDFAFLFWYTWSYQPSSYYMIYEDDIICASEFVSKVKKFVELHKTHHWIALEFSNFLTIGKLLRCNDLEKLVNFLIIFYKESPVDILINHWVQLMVPQKPPKGVQVKHSPGLFQHIGLYSTLSKKLQRLKDKMFKGSSNSNPGADLYTTIKQYKNYFPDLAYETSKGMFWGIPKPKDTFDIVFAIPLQVEKIHIDTGFVKKIDNDTNTLVDLLSDGHIEVSHKFVSKKSRQALCSNYKKLSSFVNGVADEKNLSERLKNIQCIRIVIGPEQKSWIAIRNIRIILKSV